MWNSSVISSDVMTREIKKKNETKERSHTHISHRTVQRERGSSKEGGC